MASIYLDVAEVVALAQGIAQVERRVVPAVERTTKKAALNIKKDAKARILAQVHKGYVKQYPNAITYEVETSGEVVTAEVGPDKDKRQGDLGNLLEYGTSERPPYPHLEPAFDGELDAYEQFMGDAGEKSVLP